MRRREFLGLGAVAVASASGVGCAAHRLRPDGMRLSVEAMNARLAEIDGDVARLREQFRADREGLAGADAATHAALQQLFTALLVYDAFVEMPLEGQVHPGMQDRIRAAAADLANADDALASVLDDDTVIGAMDRSLRERRREAHDRVDAMAEVADLPLSTRRRLHDLVTVAAFESSRRGMAAVRAEHRAGNRPSMAADPPEGLAAIDAERIRAIRQEWVSTGVPEEAFDRPPPTRGQVRGLRALGIVLIVVGAASVGFGVAALSCWCAGLPLILLGVGQAPPATQKRRANRLDFV